MNNSTYHYTNPQPQRKSLGCAALFDIIERTDGMSLVDILIEIEKVHGIGG
jgi:hypothetical protein